MVTTRASHVRKITPRVLARWLDINPHTVMKWVHSGELPALNIATGPVARFVIYRKDVATFLRKRGMTHDQLASLGLENGASAPK
jgi:predicted site-specific integrase-resolvase